jgi:hypothetical protein
VQPDPIRIRPPETSIGGLPHLLDALFGGDFQGQILVAARSILPLVVVAPAPRHAAVPIGSAFALHGKARLSL